MECDAETPHCPKIGRGAISNVVGIICPPGWNRVNLSAKNWREEGKSPPAHNPPSSDSSVMRLDAEVNAKQRLQFKTVD